MYNVVLVGPRHRGWPKRGSAAAPESSPSNLALIDLVLADRKAYYGADLTVISISCDTSFGKDVKTYCEENGIKFLEFVVYFNGPREKDEYTKAYLARHASLVEIGDEFHLAVSHNRKATIEDLVERVKASKKPYALYNDKNEVVEGDGWEAITGQQQAEVEIGSAVLQGAVEGNRLSA